MKTFTAISLLTFITISLSGCAKTVTPVGHLTPPASFLMAPCPPAPAIAKGDDIINKDAELRAQYAECGSNHAGLIKYVHTVLQRN